MVSVSDLNPFKDFGIGTLGMVLLIFFIALVIVALIGLVLFLFIRKRQLKHIIPLWKKIGSNVIRIAIFKAKDFKIGRAGDKLWYVPKIKKYIIPATLQTAPNEYTHFEREDGEWINISMPDIDEQMKKFGVKYIHQDMRSNRIAISDLLEARFRDKKSWWEQYGHLVTYVIFYLVVAIAMIVIFYQWSGIIERTNTILDKIIAFEKAQGDQGIIPATILIFGGLKRKWLHHWNFLKH